MTGRDAIFWYHSEYVVHDMEFKNFQPMTMRPFDGGSVEIHKVGGEICLKPLDIRVGDSWFP